MSVKFPVGTVVYLKSGGPEMTVSDHLLDDEVRCVWFDGSELKRSDFNSASLEESQRPTSLEIETF